jgi:hypothetical protein
MSNTKSEPGEALGVARYVLVIVVLVGIGFIAASHLLFAFHNWQGVVREVVKEIGITLLAVGSISLIYDYFIFEKHSHDFHERMRKEIRKGESNAAACAHLGIEEIYAQRWKFTAAYSIDDLMAGADSGTVLRIFARSAHNLMSERVHVFTAALHAGAHVQICILDPKITNDELRLTEDVTRHDLESAVWNLRKQLIPTLEKDPDGPETGAKAEPAKGQLEVKYHLVPMLDSFLDVTSNGQRVCAWDLSFGRKVELKHIFRVDPAKPLGEHLLRRYAHVWKCSKPAYEWKQGKESYDKL